LTILNASGEVVAGTPPEPCDHGVTFDEDAARALLVRVVKYTVEDRATTPGATRLARLVDEIRVELQHAGALEATKEKT